MWGKLCENSFSGWDEKNVNRNSTTLENKDWTNSHSIWEPIKSMKPKISSRDCCKSLKDSGSGATAVKHSPSPPKKCQVPSCPWESAWMGVSPLPSPAVTFSFCFSWWKSDCSQLGVWCKPSPVYLLSHTFQGVIRCPLGHHLRSTDRLW